MATLRAPKSISKRGELRKDAATTLFARLQVAYSQYRRQINGGAVAVAVLVCAVLGYRYLQGVRASQAGEALGATILVYESGDYRAALDGSGIAMGLLDIIDRYGGTPSGKLARFYAGDALFRLGDYDEAAELFEDVRGMDNMIGASALAGEAAHAEGDGDYVRAADLYRRAALLGENPIWSPGYLYAAARALEQAGELEEAEEVLLLIGDRFSTPEGEEELEFLLARVRAKMRVLQAAS